MTHKGKKHTRASKEELTKRRAGVERQEDLAKRKAAGEDISKPPTQVLTPKEKPKQTIGGAIKEGAGRALDIISAPLSQPKATFTEGIGAGAEAVRESREQIRGGDLGEAAKVVGTTIISTAVAAAATIGIGAAASALASTGGAASTSQVAATASKLGVPVKTLTAAINKKLFSQAVTDLAGIAAKKTFIGITKKQLTLVAGTLVGGSVLTQWLAADNAAGAASFMSTKIEGRFNNNELTREDALSQIDGQIDIIKAADKFTKINTMLNPALWAFRTIYVTTVENNLVTAEESRRLIFESQETTASKFDRLREESDIRDEAFVERQDARDKTFEEEQITRDITFEEKQKQSKEESDEEFRERTLLFEAIRKRNLGTELTPEEMALLIKFGLDTKLVKSGFEQPSQLSFGLL